MATMKRKCCCRGGGSPCACRGPQTAFIDLSDACGACLGDPLIDGVTRTLIFSDYPDSCQWRATWAWYDLIITYQKATGLWTLSLDITSGGCAPYYWSRSGANLFSCVAGQLTGSQSITVQNWPAGRCTLTITLGL